MDLDSEVIPEHGGGGAVPAPSDHPLSWRALDYSSGDELCYSSSDESLGSEWEYQSSDDDVPDDLHGPHEVFLQGVRSGTAQWYMQHMESQLFEKAKCTLGVFCYWLGGLAAKFGQQREFMDELLKGLHTKVTMVG